MAFKKIVQEQYKNIVDRASDLLKCGLKVPREGWIRTVRKALGMSAIQLAGRLEVSRNYISKIENEELEDTLTIKTMHKIAKAMNCRFIYAIVPERKIDDLILQQAILKAKSIVGKTNVQMALEGQQLSDDRIEQEIERIAQQLFKECPRDLWDATWGSKK